MQQWYLKKLEMRENKEKIAEFLKKNSLDASKVKQYMVAFRHRSYQENTKSPRNERVEFLGDAVLELIITDYLFRNFPYHEGKLSQIRSLIVSEKALSEIALSINLNEVILLGKGEELNGGRTKSSILANTLEAVIGCIYLIEGYEKANSKVLELFKKIIEKVMERGDHLNPKTKIQEICQKLYQQLPIYTVKNEEVYLGEKFFEVVLTIKDISFGPVRKNSKREAEEELAQIAIDFFEGLVYHV